MCALILCVFADVLYASKFVRAQISWNRINSAFTGAGKAVQIHNNNKVIFCNSLHDMIWGCPKNSAVFLVSYAIDIIDWERKLMQWTPQYHFKVTSSNIAIKCQLQMNAYTVWVIIINNPVRHTLLGISPYGICCALNYVQVKMVWRKLFIILMLILPVDNYSARVFQTFENLHMCTIFIKNNLSRVSYFCW